LFLHGVILQKRLEDDRPVTLAMLRDNWWWPWWVSTLIDLAVVAIAVTVFVASRRRAIRLVAATFVLAGLVAAVMAPIVMHNDSNGRMNRMEPGNSPTMSP
jgi:K+ transporter